MFQIGDWVWSKAYQQYGKVIDHSGLWGKAFYRLWLQQQDQVVKVPVNDLVVPESGSKGLHEGIGHLISWLATAAKRLRQRSTGCLAYFSQSPRARARSPVVTAR